MKKYLLSICISLTFLYVRAQVVSIPDSIFLKELIAYGVDTNHDLQIDSSEAKAVESLIFSLNNITDLTGIQAFTSLTSLTIAGKLTSLDVSKNVALTSLSCGGGNQLTSLDISKNTALNFLECSSNLLTTLDLSHNPNLYILSCGYNQLISLDISHNPNLSNLSCSNNKIPILDLANNPYISLLRCDRNNITSLDISGLQSLNDFDCSDNKLTSLIVGNKSYLTFIPCYHNQLTSLDLTGVTSLYGLSCNNNKLSSLILGNNNKLYALDCSRNQLNTLDVSKQINLQSFVCYDNMLTALNTTNNTALTELDCGNNQIASLDVSTNTLITKLKCDNNLLPSLDVSANVHLNSLKVDSNPNLDQICINSLQNSLTSNWTKDSKANWNTNCGMQLDIVYIPDTNFRKILMALGVDTNKNGEIELNEAQAITSLDVSNQSIQDLTGIQAFISLTSLNCSHNQLDTLNLAKNTKLVTINCGFNQIVKLIWGSQIANLMCNDNQLSTLSLLGELLVSLNCQNNPNLDKICLSFSQFKEQTANETWLKDPNTNWAMCEIFLGLQNSQFQTITPVNLIGIYNPLGQAVSSEEVRSGVYIYQYSDGSTKKVMKLE